MSETKPTTDFGAWLIQRMSVLGLRNVDVARATQVSGPAVSLWRSNINVPENKRIDDLARILQVSPETILIKLGRMQPREGIPHNFEELITRFQDHGPEAQNLFFATADALLRLRVEPQAAREVFVHLDPLFDMANPGQTLPTDVDEIMLWFGPCQLEAETPFLLSVSLGVEDESHVTVRVEDNSPDELHVSLRLGLDLYDGERIDNTHIFRDVPLTGTMGWIVLVLTYNR